MKSGVGGGRFGQARASRAELCLPGLGCIANGIIGSLLSETDESKTFNVSAFSKMLTALKQIHILETYFPLPLPPSRFIRPKGQP